MFLLDSNFFEITKYITHPISLVAYVCALITFGFIFKNINDRKKLEANPEAYKATAERLNLDFEKIPEIQRASVTFKVLKNRITSQIILAVSLIAGGLIIAYISINYIQSNSFERQQEYKAQQEERRIQDSIMESHRRDSLAILQTGDSLKLLKERQANKIHLIVTRGKAIIDSIYAGSERAWNVSAYFYGNDVLNTITEVESKREDKKYNIKYIQYNFDNKRPHYDNPQSQRIIDSTYALREVRFYIDLLQELETTL